MPPKMSEGLLYKPKDMVLAKMTGFPAWPSFVMPAEMIPTPIMKAKKKTTNTCVIFIPDGDFNWMNEKSLEALTPEKLQARLDKVSKDKLKTKTKKKSTRTNSVIDALLAASGLGFDDFMDDLDNAKESLEEDVEDDDERDVEHENGEEVEADKQKDTHTENPSQEDTDIVDVTKDVDVDGSADKENAAIPSKISNTIKQEAGKDAVRGKRRLLRSMRDRTSGPDFEESNDKSLENDEVQDTNNCANETEEADQNGALNALYEAEKAEDEEEEVVRKSTIFRKRTRDSRGSEPSAQDLDTTTIADGNRIEDKNIDADEPVAKKLANETRESRENSPKPMNEKDRQHQLWLCRIKLQRSLIQRNQPMTPKDPKSFPPPTVDELLMARIILQKLVDFPVTVELLRDTKIHKVLKCIVKDDDLEYPESFRLHEKCKELLRKWQVMIDDLKQVRAGKPDSRVGSSAPEDSEISGIELKPSLDKEYAAKLEA